MRDAKGNVLERIRAVIAGPESRADRARRLADIIRDLRSHRWVGVYDVDSKSVSIIAWSGTGPPAFPTFHITKGLTASVISQKATVVVGDVSKDPRYLTAFGSTQSEIIVPVIDPKSGNVIGTIDIESDRKNAFTKEDQQTLESCAKAALALWTIR